jgi:hypothetical protein
MLEMIMLMLAVPEKRAGLAGAPEPPAGRASASRELLHDRPRLPTPAGESLPVGAVPRYRTMTCSLR